MEANLKKILRSVSLELRHTLEGRYDEHGHFLSGDLERRLNEIGIWRERPSKPIGEMPHLSVEDRAARIAIDAYILFREEAEVPLVDAVAEFVRESAYTWANRLFALRCMEARAIIDEVILQKDVYGGRSMVHNRYARKNPEKCTGADDGLFDVLFDEFAARANELPTLFDPKSPAIALRPSVAALKRCIALFSGRETARGQEPASDDVFSAPDAFGWAYQYWNFEEKERVFELVRTQKGAKIEGADIIPATQLYTEPYMVKFLVQYSLGAIWLGMHPESRLNEGWEYYVKDTDRSPVDLKPVREITLLDPAVGSGHFLLEGFDLFYSMYEEEGELETPAEICASILNNNLFGIDIDGRAVQIATAVLWMKAKEKAPDLNALDISSFREHLTATNICLPKNKDHLEIFLKKHPEDEPLRLALETVFYGLENAHEIGSLLQIEEPVERALKALKLKNEIEQSPLSKKEQGGFWDTNPQSALPISAEEWKEWKQATIGRLHEHFVNESESVDLVQAYFGVFAKLSFGLFELLSNKYSVVVANPPYMGSHKMGKDLNNYLRVHYSSCCRDLYASFIARICSLLCCNGKAAFVTMHGFMFLSSFEKLREFLLTKVTLTQMAHLGTYAFDELGDHAPATLTCISNVIPNDRHNIQILDITETKEKAYGLLSRMNCKSSCIQVFKKLPHFRFLYSLNDEVLSIFKENSPLEIPSTFEPESAIVRRGLDTGSVPRFCRCFWEQPQIIGDWSYYCKGGDTRKWYGNTTYIVRWHLDGFSRINFMSNSIVPSRDLYPLEGITFSRSSGTGLNIRYLPSGTIIGCEGPGIFHSNNIWTLLAYLASRTTEAIAAIINPSMHYQTGDVALIPIPNTLYEDQNLANAAKICFNLSKEYYSFFLTDPNYVHPVGPHKSPNDLIVKILINQASIMALRLAIEGVIDTLSLQINDLSMKVGSELFDKVGTSTGWLPLLKDFDDLPSHFNDRLHSLKDLKFNIFDEIKEIDVRDKNSVIQQLKKIYELGPGEAEVTENQYASDEEDEEEIAEKTRKPIPPETFLEELSLKLGLHPFSICIMLIDGIKTGGWRCPMERQRISNDFISSLILRLLGHRTSKQIEEKEKVPEWVDKDGIIPLTGDCGEKTLLERIRERIAEEFNGGSLNTIEQELSEITGIGLEKWIAGPFFKRHVSQFKKRPIAWHIQSVSPDSFLGRGKVSRGTRYCPAFAALLYYHKLGPTTLLDIRKLYVDKLRISYETEFRTLERNNQPSPEQVSRKINLECWIEELKDFDKKLEEVARTAFGPERMRPALHQYAVADAMSSLVACWLRRLTQAVQSGPLKSWQETAKRTGLHIDFPLWLRNSTSRLDFFCSAVGPKVPNEPNFAVDPRSADFAHIISTNAAVMVKGSIAKACVSWWRDFDEMVLLPIRQAITETNKNIRSMVEERESMECSKSRNIVIERTLKQLKAILKWQKKEISEKTELANTVRREMESWQCYESESWGEWLTSQPLFDNFVSLDGKKSAPSTIAEFIAQEIAYIPDINDGVRVNIAPLQKAGLLAADTIAVKDIENAIADRAEWRADERRWCREGKLQRPGWWKFEVDL